MLTSRLHMKHVNCSILKTITCETQVCQRYAISMVVTAQRAAAHLVHSASAYGAILQIWGVSTHLAQDHCAQAAQHPAGRVHVPEASQLSVQAQQHWNRVSWIAHYASRRHTCLGLSVDAHCWKTSQQALLTPVLQSLRST